MSDFLKSLVLLLICLIFEMGVQFIDLNEEVANIFSFVGVIGAVILFILCNIDFSICSGFGSSIHHGDCWRPADQHLY